MRQINACSPGVVFVFLFLALQTLYSKWPLTTVYVQVEGLKGQARCYVVDVLCNDIIIIIIIIIISSLSSSSLSSQKRFVFGSHCQEFKELLTTTFMPLWFMMAEFYVRIKYESFAVSFILRLFFLIILTPCGLITPYGVKEELWGPIGSDNGLLSNGPKSLPELAPCGLLWPLVPGHNHIISSLACVWPRTPPPAN